MKGENTRGYPYRRYPPTAWWNWLIVDLDEGGRPEYSEKNPRSQIEIDWNSPHANLGIEGWTGVAEVESRVHDNRR